MGDLHKIYFPDLPILFIPHETTTPQTVYCIVSHPSALTIRIVSVHFSFYLEAKVEQNLDMEKISIILLKHL